MVRLNRCRPVVRHHLIVKIDFIFPFSYRVYVSHDTVFFKCCIRVVSNAQASTRRDSFINKLGRRGSFMLASIKRTFTLSLVM